METRAGLESAARRGEVLGGVGESRTAGLRMLGELATFGGAMD